MFERADIDHSTVDLKFDDATADALMKVCRDAASALEEKIPAQKTAADTALQEFKGTSPKFISAILKWLSITVRQLPVV